jgi:hypothetical protein
MSAPKIYADFQNLDDFNRLRLTCAGTIADLARQGIELREGLILTFCMDDADDQDKPDELLAEGVVHFDPEERVWVASIDWSAVRHASEEKNRSLTEPDSANGAPALDTKATKSRG